MAVKSNFRAGRNNDALTENVELLTGQRGDGLDRAITLRELNNLGLASLSRINGVYTSKNGTVPGASTPGVVDHPSKPLNVTVNGAFNTILISWDEPNYRGHAYAEVWRAETNNLSVAVMIGTSAARMYSDPIGGDAHVYYWVRFVNKNDVPGPYNSTAGTYGETAVDIGQLLDSLTGQITDSQLAQTLLAKVDKITLIDRIGKFRVVASGYGGGTSSVTDSLNETVVKTGARSWNLVVISKINHSILFTGTYDVFTSSTNAQLLADKLNSYADYSCVAIIFTYDEPRTNLIANLKTALVRYGATQATLDGIVYRGAYVLAGIPGIGAGNGEEYVKNIEAGHIETVISLTNGYLDGQSSASVSVVVNEITARIDADSAMASNISTVSAVANAKNKTFLQTAAPTSGMVTGDLWYDTDDNNKTYRYSGSAWVLAADARIAANAAAIIAEQTARANADSAMASNITTVQAVLAGDPSNLFLNGTFLSNVHGFSGFGNSFGNSDANVHDAGYQWAPAGCPAPYYLEIWNRDMWGKTIPVVPGEVYHFSMSCATGDGGAPRIGIGCVALNASGGVINYYLAATRSDATAEWKRISGEMTVPAGCTQIRMWVQLDYFRDATHNHWWAITGIQWTNGNATKTVSAAVVTEQNARVSGDNANASAIQTVQTNLNGTNSTVQTLSSSVATIDSTGSAAYRAMWAVKGSVGNITAGIGLMVSGGVSQVMISASQFFVFDPNSAAPTQSLFAVSDGKVVIQKAVIEKATIETVTAMSITADYVRAGVSITSPAINGGTLSIGSGDNSCFMEGGAIGIGKGGPHGGWGYGWHTIIYNDGALYTDRLYASAGSFTGTVNANAGTFNNVTINENCDVKGTIYANKIVGDVVAIKNYNIPAQSAVRTTTLLSGTVLSHTKNRLMMFTDIRITRFSTVQKSLQVSIYVDGVQVWHGRADSATKDSYTANPPPLRIASGANRSFSISVYTDDNSYLSIPAQDIQCTVAPTSSGTFA